MDRPTEAVFADGKKPIALALLPSAIGVTYATREIGRFAEVKDQIAILSIDGPLEHKGGGWWSWWQSYERIASDFATLCESDEVRAIVLKFDSPGGEVAGLGETVRIMREMRDRSAKRVVAYIDEACYSAAYALACVADEIVIPPSGGCGSIGVITALLDLTAAHEKDGIRVEVIASGSKKTDGHPSVAISDGAIKRTRRTVDKFASQFFELVADARPIDVETIASYQAGTFIGQSAVDVGLADAVMSLEECLTFLSLPSSPEEQPPDRSGEKEAMPTQLAAAKALADANKALAGAKTDHDRALAAARVIAAEADVAEAKVVKKITKETHQELIDDGESEGSSSGSSESSDTSESSSSGSSESSESSEGTDAAKAMRGDNATTGLYTRDRLLRLCRQIVGSPTSGPTKKSIEEVMGALHAMWQSHKGHASLAAEVKQLKAENERTKVRGLIEKGLANGKLAPSQKEWAKTLSPAGLKAYLDAAPRLVGGIADEHTEAQVTNGVAGVTPEMAKIWTKQGFKAEDFPRLVAKLNASKTNGAS